MATGFKGLGAWCHPIFHESAGAHHARSEHLGLGAGRASSPLRPGLDGLGRRHRARRHRCRCRTTRTSSATTSTTKWTSATRAWGPGVYFDWLPPDNPNRLEVMKVIRELWPPSSSSTRRGGCNCRSSQETRPMDGPAQGPARAYSRLQSAWLEKLMADYFRPATELVRAYDPQPPGAGHPLCGLRAAGSRPGQPRLHRCAVHQLLRERRRARSADVPRRCTKLSGQPIIISEYSFHSLDGRSGNRNTVGFQAQVTRPAARADAYRLFTSRPGPRAVDRRR